MHLPRKHELKDILPTPECLIISNFSDLLSIEFDCSPRVRNVWIRPVKLIAKIVCYNRIKENEM